MSSALWMTVWFALIIISLWLHKYLNLNQYPLIRYAAIGVMVVIIFGSLLVMFTGFSF